MVQSKHAQSLERRKQAVLTKEKASSVSDISDATVIKDESIFFLTQPDGQVPLKGHHGLGLYYHDCRYLNGFELKIRGRWPFPLAHSAKSGFHAELVLTNQEFSSDHRKNVPEEKLSMTWNRMVDDCNCALYDSLEITNLGHAAIVVPIEVVFRCAFEDIFQVRGLCRERFGRMHQSGELTDGGWRFSYCGADHRWRTLVIKTVPTPDKIKKAGGEFLISLKSRETRKILLELSIHEGQADVLTASLKRFSTSDLKRMINHKKQRYGRWFKEQTELKTDNVALGRAITSSLRDLHLLRTTIDGQSFFAAGIPWFVTLFGRDTLISAIQTLAFNPATSHETLQILAHYQGHEVNEWKNEEPGKILHELRIGEMAAAQKIPYTPFYGSVDATPLFLILAVEYLRWTGDADFFNLLRPNIEAAVSWMDLYGDSDGDGYLDYKSPRVHGALINQGWKDSGNGIVRADGSIAQPPIALAEVQGYMYRAKTELAAVFRRFGERDKAARLQKEADALRCRFNRDFWVDEKQVFAMALEKGGRPLKVVSSNAGRTLWCGIADPVKARKIARRLMADDSYSGWGVRTLSTKEKSFNPLSYHLGSVWPHDNALFAQGLRQYRFDESAQALWNGLLDAVLFFKHERLPELFCGYARKDFSEPVRYPVACHPQAWAAGSIPYLVQVMLGLHPNALDHGLDIIRPILPSLTEYITLKRLRVGAARADIRFSRSGDGGVKVDITNVKGRLNIQVKK